MKKSEILGLTVALAGSIAAVMPQAASATACGTTPASANDISTCTITATGYLAEDLTFSGSKGVAIDYDVSDAAFAACAYHISGTKSFGMSTASTAMAILSSTGGTADLASGCAGAGGGGSGT
jgi:hypothetical protein